MSGISVDSSITTTATETIHLTLSRIDSSPDITTEFREFALCFFFFVVLVRMALFEFFTKAHQGFSALVFTVPVDRLISFFTGFPPTSTKELKSII